jgi:hypothetical protein
VAVAGCHEKAREAALRRQERTKTSLEDPKEKGEKSILILKLGLASWQLVRKGRGVFKLRTMGAGKRKEVA